MLIVNFVGCALSSAAFLNHDAKILQFPDTTKFQRVIRRDFSTLSIRNLLNNLTRSKLDFN